MRRLAGAFLAALIATSAHADTTAPTPPAGDNSNRIATTAFVHAAVVAAAAGVTSFNGRTGAVVPAINDYSFSQISGSIAVSQITACLGGVLNGSPLTCTSAPQLGLNSGATGALDFAGVTSGTTRIDVPPAAGSYRFTLPITAGTAGYVLASGGGAGVAMTWTQLAAVATSGSASDLGTGTLPVARIAAASIAAAKLIGTDIATVGTLTAGSTGAGFTIALGTSTVTGALGPTNGGTGNAVYAIGDLLYASTTTVLSRLADVATGNALISGGVGVAPSFGKIGLTTHVSGTLPVANGGSNCSSASITCINNLSGGSLSGAVVGTSDTQALTGKTLNGLTVTSSTGTLTITNGKTLAASNSLTFTGTDGNSFAFPSGSDTVVTLAATQTLTNKSISGAQVNSGTVAVANGGTGDSGTAWTSYTPSLTCGGGATTGMTASGRYKTLGKTVFVFLKLTSGGTTSCTSAVLGLPPFTSQSEVVLGGMEGIIIGTGFRCSANSAAATTCSILNLTAGTGNSAQINAAYVFSGNYESQ